MSAHDDPDRASDLEKVIRYVITTMRPELLFFTGNFSRVDLLLLLGDLTDNRAKHGLSSVQFEGEWKKYRQILEGSGIMNVTNVHDIRGNHGDGRYSF